MLAPPPTHTQASLADLRVPDYIAEDPLIKAMGVTRDQVVEALKAVGFTDDLLVRGWGGCGGVRVCVGGGSCTVCRVEGRLAQLLHP
jgi:hypothetical protein